MSGNNPSAEDRVEGQPSTRSLRDLSGLIIDGKYRLEKRIGKGGMGAVYAARHTKFNKQLAIKVLSQDLVDDANSYNRFVNEANTTGILKHPNIVSVSDFGQTDDGIVYLVMEYVDGISLRQLLDKEGRLSIDRSMLFCRQICDAISLAHKCNVIHRDLKPDNVMIETINNREIARVLDFGIAKLKDTTQNMTKTGNVLGTPHYMSPEQCSAGVIDHRSDIYSLGVMIYEMLAGRLPFDGPTPVAVVVQHVTKDPPVLHEIADVPEPISKVVMRALEKEPSRRQQTAEDLIEQLEAAVEILDIPETATAKMPVPVQPQEWRAVFKGPLENTEEGRLKVLEGLQKRLNFSYSKASELLQQAPAIVKRSNSQKEVSEIAEKLRAIGADVKVEPIVDPAQKMTKAIAPPENRETKEVNSETSTALDPLLVTGNEMMVYMSKRLREKSETVEISKPEPSSSSEKETVAVEPPTQHAPKVGQATTAVDISNLWFIDINGTLYENMTEEDVEAWIRSSRLRVTYKARKGNGIWRELGAIPQFRKVFQEVSPHIFEPVVALDPEETRGSGSRNFLTQMVKLAGVVLALYVIVGFAMQYWQRKLLVDELEIVLKSPKTSIYTLPTLVRNSIKNRDLDVPDENIHIIANPPEKKVTVRVDYSRSILAIPLRYQALAEHTGMELTIDDLARVAEGRVEIVGISPSEVSKYKQKQLEMQAAARLAGYRGEPETVREYEAMLQLLKECEDGLKAFDVTSIDEDGRKVLPSTVKIRDREYTREALQYYLEDVKIKVGDLERLLKEQREKKIQEEAKK